MTLDPEQWRRASAVLDAALDLPPDSRAGYVERACAGDAALRRLVEDLLAAESAAGDAFLESPAAERAAPLLAGLADTEAAPATTGRVVGPYRLLAELGEGGMGTVHLAERADGQFEQQVAIKLLKQGLHGELAQRRFLQERQILARLQHPAIAKLLDGGVTDEGVPYFVMERVDGVPVTDYCWQRQLGVAETLRVFLEVCDAAQYAHGNLVVHRDLKPSNILVDAAGHAKLLDFGIAKLLAEDDPEAPAATRTLVRALTPEYAAPEQLRGDPVTTATDVYALGVLLYELLTGERPYRVRRNTTGELERAILEQEPERPSTRAPRLRGDLDWIVLKALSKEPERRYHSAEALAGDLRRYLQGLPVAARRDTLRYRTGKFLRRHRLSAAAAVLVVLSLVGGLVGTAWQARRARREAQKAEAVTEFLGSLFAASDPAQSKGQERTARQLLDDGAARIETELKDQPEVQSDVARLISAVYLQLGEYDKAIPLLRTDIERRRALDGPRSIEVAESETRLANVLGDAGRSDEAAPLYEDAYAIQVARRGERAPEVAELLYFRAGIKSARNDLHAAEDMYKRALALYVETKGDDSGEATAVRNSLSIVASHLGRFQEAADLEASVASWNERHLGPDHPNTLNARYNLAYAELLLGRTSEAVRVSEDVAARQRRVMGARHDRLALTLRLLARALDADGRSEEALPKIVEAVAIHRERFGDDHIQVAMDLAWQGLIEVHAARPAEGERDGRDGLRRFVTHPGITSGDLASMRTHAGLIFTETDRLTDADEQLTQGVALERAERRGDSYLGFALDALSALALKRGQAARAATLGQEAVRLLERGVGPDHPASALARVHAGAALWASGEAATGERLLRSGVLGLERCFPHGHRDLATARFLLGTALARDERRPEARALLEAALAWRQAHLGASDPRTTALRQALASLGR